MTILFLFIISYNLLQNILIHCQRASGRKSDWTPFHQESQGYFTKYTVLQD